MKKELLLRGGRITSCGAGETEPAGRASGSAGAAHHRKGARNGLCAQRDGGVSDQLTRTVCSERDAKSTGRELRAVSVG
jgi:hypothetical protein